MLRPVSALLLAALVAGCGSAPAEPPRLAELRTRLDQARADPTVSRYSGVQLQEAQQSLASAEADARSGNEPAMAHDAYMAERRIDIARAHAQALSVNEQARATVAQAQAQAAEQRARSLEEELQGLRARQTAQGAVLTLTDLLFDPGQATLRAGASNRLQPLATYLRAHPQATATIQGFTDSTGSPQTNLTLSQRRAEAVRDFLVGEGIDPGRIAALGKGEDFPIASNTTPVGRQQNRRVEVLLSEVPQ